jgi:predicted GNAT superfamily acetyltransferase
LEEVLRLQQAIWGFADIELLPLRFLALVGKIGGHIFGAYDGGIMVGFCFAIPGIKPGGRAYLHSHMLGVLPAYQNAGVGRQLKLHQRDEALARGIELIEWTFDPLELKNAFFNIERLGAIVRHYNENQYGVTASPLHGGLPTDRCYAEWWLASPRVNAKLAASATSPAPALLVGRTPAPDPLVRPSGDVAQNSNKADEGVGVPSGPGQGGPPYQRISYPTDIARIRAEDPRRARQIQKHNAEQFRLAFSQGLAVTGFERSDTACTYLLEPWS